MTKHDVNFIWTKMPLAQGRQYEKIFYAKHKIPYTELGGAEKTEGLKTHI